MSNKAKYSNSLVHASSPYLLQHAHNPVDWFEWSNEAWEKAKKENKPVLVSIGYAACHWCHVMERETFENEDSASIMNEYFVCIKIDREERPDIDQVYMQALQLMGVQGGWPLNVFCLPDGRAIYGGTYFPNKHWNQLLFQLNDLYHNKKEEVLDYAQKLIEGMQTFNKVTIEEDAAVDREVLESVYQKWKADFDWKYGGNARSPKFPLPNNYLYLLNYGQIAGNEEALKFVQLTLTKMALSGLNDQLQGGFARYSVDERWFAPHFEKMLYDNAQLLSLYSKAYNILNKKLFAETARETFEFCLEEWQSPEGLFFSSFDADSEGVEGKYYVWTKEEVEQILGDDAKIFCEYHQITAAGNWEHNWNILYPMQSVEAFCERNKYDIEKINRQLSSAKAKLLEERKKRVKPGLDDKAILSWNALMLEALCDAYAAFGDEKMLTSLNACIAAIKAHYLKDGEVVRIYKNGKSSIPAFLEDYANLIKALIAVYQTDYMEESIQLAQDLTEKVLEEFYDEEDGLFFYKSVLDEPLVVRKKDLTDDVISSSNSVMAKNLFTMFYITGNSRYEEVALRMLKVMSGSFVKSAAWYSNWGQSYLSQAYGTFQIVATGPSFKDELEEAKKISAPAIITAGAETTSALALLQDRIKPGTTQVFICHGKNCYLPGATLEDAIKMLPEEIKSALTAQK